MNDTKIRWEEMFPDEFVAAREAHPICYMGYGLSEPHGAYNALGLDFLKAQGILERAAKTHGGIVAPPMAWHITDLPSFHTGPDGWFAAVGIKQSLASSIPADLFYRMLLFQIRAFDERGFHAAILVTGHYGGLEHHMRLLCDYYVRRTGTPMQIYACADWELIRYEDYRGDHAGVTETSQLMAIRPDLVDLEKEPVPAELGTRFAGSEFPNGKGHSPSQQLGEQIVASQVARINEIKDELFSAYQPRDGWTAPSMTDAEDIWHRYDSLTRKYWTSSYAEYRGKSAPEFPGWDALGE